MNTDLILGTAGHIDHGKTSLILALTGTNTDRLPEEKKRGITIELGYAQLELPPYRLGIVDVPGHEKFVRQMLAGATGMDLALLVIAADDSVKQQTTEHLDILRMLDLKAGVIALTKCDLPDPDWLELVEDEIRQLVDNSFLKNAPIIRTSSKTGAGIDQLKLALRSACEIATQVDDSTGSATANSLVSDETAGKTPFRMAIDRAFSIEGHGTIVTGSVSSGELKVGDQVEIQPGGATARVRSLQNHDSGSDSVHRGQRAAINLAGVNKQDVDRGHELCSVGHLVPTEMLTVQLQLLDRVSKPLKDRTRVRFHIGTAELFGNVRLIQAHELQPGESGFAQIFLNEPTVAVWNQPFVLRHQSPVETIGGGRVLHPNAFRIRKPTAIEMGLLNDLDSTDPATRAAAAVYFSDSKTWQPSELARSAGIADVESAYHSLLATGELIQVPITATRHATIHRQQLETLTQRILKTLTRLHEQHPLRFTHARSMLDTEFSYLAQPELLNIAIEQLKQQKQIVANVNSIGLTGFGPKLSKGQKQLLEQLVAEFKTKGLKAPSVSELESGAKKNKDSVAELLELAVENGELVRVASDLYIHVDTLNLVKAQLKDALADNHGLTMSEIRTVIDTTRKYAVPLCEFLDRIGFTKRVDDHRVLNTQSPANE